MIDSIHIRLSRKLLTEQQVKHFKTLLTPHRKKYQCFGVRFEADNIIIWGSLPRYILGNNVESLPFSAIADAIQKLSDDTGLPLFDGELTRVDIAESFLVDNNIRHYFANLLDTPGFQRNRIPTRLSNGVQYERGFTVFSFYNKTDEAYEVPGIKFKNFDKQSVIRLELRIMKNVRRTALNNSPGISVRVLTDPTFHKRLAKLWRMKYDAILKKRDMVKHGKIKDGKAFEAYIIASYLHTEKRFSQTLEELNAFAKENCWSRQLKFKVKKRLMDKYQDKNLTIASPYMRELDAIVKAGKLYTYATDALHKYGKWVPL